MNKEVFITRINFNNNIYNIFYLSGKYLVKDINNNIIDNSIAQKLIQMTYNPNAIIKIHLVKNIKQLSIIGIAALELFSNPTLVNQTTNEKNYTIEDNENIIDEKLFSDYVSAIYSNPNISDKDKQLLMKKFTYVNKNKDNINSEFLINSLAKLKINYLNKDGNNLSGIFYVDVNNNPIINIYSNASNNEDVLSHEIYHLLHNNKYYFDKTYYYNNQFIGTDEYMLLNDSEKSKCENVSVNGIMLEEAYTSLNVIEEHDNTNRVPEFYAIETEVFKIYENIFGKDTIDEIMFKPNPTKEFLNLLLDNGCSKEQAIAIIARLDLFNSFTVNGENIDLSNLKYNISDDFAFVYKNKYGNINNDIVKNTALSICFDINYDFISSFENDFKTPELYDELKNRSISVNNNLCQLEDNEYPLNILISYSDEDIPTYNIFTDNNNLYKVCNNEVSIINNYKKNDDEYNNIMNMYNNYYEFAINTYNDEAYAKFFASIYANPYLVVEEKSAILEYYDKWSQMENKDEIMASYLLNKNYNSINNLFATQNKEITR